MQMAELKSVVMKIKISLDGLHVGEETKNRISDLAGRPAEFNQCDQQRENRLEKKKNEQNSGAGRTVTKKANLHYQSPRRRGVKRVFQKIMAENFPTFIDTNLQTQEAE